MTINPLLAAAPPDPDELALATFLEEAFARHSRGEPVRAAELLAHSPRLVSAGEQLLADARDLFGAAVGLRYWSRLVGSEQLDGRTDEADTTVELVDPFPGVFRLVRRLGRGAFGSVWLVDDLQLGRQVALKMILPACPTAEADCRLDRLRDEARLLALVRHPNIVPVLSWQEGKDAQGKRTAALVMPFVPGGSLADRVRREGPLPWWLAARYLADVADGLLAVHAAGLVHRDVKPANILWDPAADEALLTDFGLSARLHSEVGAGGTAFYMAPEAFEGRCGPAQDVYGLAASLFWLVTGSVPFPAMGLECLMEQIRRGLAEADSRCADLPGPLESVIRAGLAADPVRRLDLADFAARLRGSLNHLMADTLLLPRLPRGGAPASVAGLRLTVSRQDGTGQFTSVVTTRPVPERLVRDLRRVPPQPERVEARTGDRLRIEVEADRAGHIVVFNIGPTGNLNLLYPDTLTAHGEIDVGRPMHVIDVELTPPAGGERVFALWSRTKLPLRLDELADLAAGGGPTPSRGGRATRDLRRVQESVFQLRPEDWQSVVLELNHIPLQETRSHQGRPTP